MRPCTFCVSSTFATLALCYTYIVLRSNSGDPTSMGNIVHTDHNHINENNNNNNNIDDGDNNKSNSYNNKKLRNILMSHTLHYLPVALP